MLMIIKTGQNSALGFLLMHQLNHHFLLQLLAREVHLLGKEAKILVQYKLYIQKEMIVLFKKWILTKPLPKSIGVSKTP
jgi:hypothetical protein